MFSIMLVNKDTKIFYGNNEIKKIYLGSNLVWQRQTMDESTLAIINYANINGYAIPSNLTAFDNLIKGMKSCGIWALLDRFWLFSGDGSTDFKRINLINPSKTRADFYGGLTISNSGIQGNGTNAYVDTNFNPSLLVTGQKYQLNDASRLIIIYEGTQLGTNVYNSQFTLDGMLSMPDKNLMQNTNRSQIINSISSDAQKSPLSGIGIKIIGINNNKLNIISNNQIFSQNKAPSLIYNSKQAIFRDGGSKYGNSKICSYGMGASIPFQVSQDFRAVFNTYLSAIGQTPIA